MKISTPQNEAGWNLAPVDPSTGKIPPDLYEAGGSSSTGPAMKNEATAENNKKKKDISIYKIELTTATTFTFDWSQLDSEICYTFELWVSMSTPVTLTFPSDVAWLNNEVPDMSEVSTYCIVVRKLPATMGTSTITSPKALLNLAYQYALTLG